MNNKENTNKMVKDECINHIHLIDVANVLYGYPLQAKNFCEDSSYLPVVRIRDIKAGFSTTYYRESVPMEYIVHLGDILVGMDGEFNLSKWRSREAILNQRVCKIESKDESIILNQYLFHLLGPIFKKIEKNIQGSTVKHLSAKIINSIKIPLPPLPIQQEIVRILDTFTNLTAELTAELTARRKQYEYYRDELLRFKNRKDIQWVPFGDYFEFKNGLNKGKEYFGSGNYIVNFTDVYKNRCLEKSMLKGRVQVEDKEVVAYSAQKGDVFFTRTSETREEIGMVSALVDDIDGCVFSGFVLRARPLSQNWLPKFCAYFFSTSFVRKEIIRYASFTTRALTSGPRLSKIKLPLLPIQEQEKIVDILDNFSSLCNGVEKGLPAEISARQKQYEYYRDQLLTFKRIGG